MRLLHRGATVCRRFKTPYLVVVIVVETSIAEFVHAVQMKSAATRCTSGRRIFRSKWFFLIVGRAMRSLCSLTTRDSTSRSNANTVSTLLPTTARPELTLPGSLLGSFPSSRASQLCPSLVLNWTLLCGLLFFNKMFTIALTLFIAHEQEGCM